MAFKVTSADIKKGQRCPAGMCIATLITVDDPYLKDNGNEVQKCEFETASGHIVPKWFNALMITEIVEFVEAADDVKFKPEEVEDFEVDLRDYKGKKVAISVSHGKDKNNKLQAQIDNFFSATKVPF